MRCDAPEVGSDSRGARCGGLTVGQTSRCAGMLRRNEYVRAKIRIKRCSGGKAEMTQKKRVQGPRDVTEQAGRTSRWAPDKAEGVRAMEVPGNSRKNAWKCLAGVGVGKRVTCADSETRCCLVGPTSHENEAGESFLGSERCLVCLTDEGGQLFPPPLHPPRG